VICLPRLYESAALGFNFALSRRVVAAETGLSKCKAAGHSPRSQAPRARKAALNQAPGDSSIAAKTLHLRNDSWL